MLKIHKYDRSKAVDYALEYALKNNSQYFDYSNSGGNCTNYVSQCVFAGTGVMNVNINGWYYYTPNNTSYSWANVEPFYNFFTSNLGVGPFGKTGTLSSCEVGDIIQLRFSGKQNFSHALIITQIKSRTPNGIYVCANTRNVRNVPLSNYIYADMRVIHILGYRKNI